MENCISIQILSLPLNSNSPLTHQRYIIQKLMFDATVRRSFAVSSQAHRYNVKLLLYLIYIYLYMPVRVYFNLKKHVRETVCVVTYTIYISNVAVECFWLRERKNLKILSRKNV